MWKKLAETKKPIVLYGTGNACERIMNELNARGIKISGIFASNDFVRGQEFHGYKVMTYLQAKEAFDDMIVLVCFGSHLEQVINNIRLIAAVDELYAPDLPVVGEGLFTSEYADDHADDIEWLMETLADEQSCNVLNELIEYRISGDIEHLFRAETDENENRALLTLGSDEVYVDLGAYTGDTVYSFIDAVGDYKKIIAVEPEDRNFRKLEENTDMLSNIKLVHAAIGKDCREIMFTHGVGRGGAVGKGKTRPIQQVSLDSITYGEKISYIKMDLEGEELSAIDGALNTIKNHTPKMEIAVYHRIDDYWTIPKKVLSINPNYDVYIRKAPCLPCWEVNMYFVPKNN